MLKIAVVGYGKMLASLVKGVILSSHELAGVFRYDRVKYNKFTLFLKDIFAPSLEYSLIKSYNTYDIKANSVNSKEFIREVKKLGADVILVGSWGEKFRDETINSVKYCINCHPALLPRNRGANPYFWVLYQGQAETGVTFHLMNGKYDRGDILFQGSFKITDDMNAGTLKDKSCKIAENMVIDLLDDIEKKRIFPIPQDENLATYEKQITFKNLIIDFKRTNREIRNHFRALYPNCSAFFSYNDNVYKIKSFSISDENEFFKNFNLGEVIKKEKGKITFRTVDGAITIEY